MTPHRIAVIPGDGIGPEVIPEALACLETVAAAHGVALETVTFDWGSERYLAEGAMMPADGPEQLAAFDAILLGPVGDPRIPDTVTGWGLILSLRQIFDQYVNLRPARLLPGVHSPLGGVTPEDVDIVFVRENTEGEYAGAGGRVHGGHPTELAVETSVFTRDGIERIVRYAFEHARDHGPPARHERDEVQRAASRDAAVGRRVRRGRGGVPADHDGQLPHRRARRAHGARSRVARRGGGQQPLRRHPHRPRGGHRRQPGHRAERQPRSRRAATRACSRRSTARRRTSPGAASPTRWPRSGPPRCCSTSSASPTPARRS